MNLIAERTIMNLCTFIYFMVLRIGIGMDVLVMRSGEEAGRSSPRLAFTVFLRKKTAY